MTTLRGAVGMFRPPRERHCDPRSEPGKQPMHADLDCFVGRGPPRDDEIACGSRDVGAAAGHSGSRSILGRGPANPRPATRSQGLRRQDRRSRKDGRNRRSARRAGAGGDAGQPARREARRWPRGDRRAAWPRAGREGSVDTRRDRRDGQGGDRSCHHKQPAARCASRRARRIDPAQSRRRHPPPGRRRRFQDARRRSAANPGKGLSARDGGRRAEPHGASASRHTRRFRRDGRAACRRGA